MMDRLCGFFFTAFSLLTVCTGEINIRYDIRSWNEAREACRTQVNLGSCDLITKTRLHEEWAKLGLSGSESYWVGGQRFYRWFWDQGNVQKLRLFEDHGCYKLTVDESKLGQPRNNGPHKCYSVCENNAFVYLKGDKCYCANALEGEVASSDKCDLPCDGSDDKCGGKDGYYSVFSIPQEILFVDRDQSRDCAAGQIKENELHVESTDCKRYRHYFCVSDKQANEVSARSEQFDTAVSRCKTRHNSSLPTLSSYEGAGQLLTDLRAVSDKIPGSAFTTFWLPLQRRVKAVWVDGQEGEEGGEFGDCLAATPRTAGYRLTDLPCSQSHAAICDCSRGTGPVDPGTNGNNDDDKKPDPNTGIIVAIVLIALLVTACAVVGIIILRRRMMAARELELLSKKWDNRPNPLYKETPETQDAAD